MNPSKGLIALLVAICPLLSFAQNYPDHPIHIVVPFPAGGGSDLAGRVVAQRLAEVLHTPVVVDNRPGAGGSLAAHFVAAAKPDGYTLLATTTAFLLKPAITPAEANYDPVKDFSPVINLGSTPIVLVMNSTLKATNFKELVALAITQKVFYSSAGVGTVPHIFVEYMNRELGTHFTHVPYSGAAAALEAVAGEHVPMASLGGETVAVMRGLIESKHLNAIVVSGLQPWSQWPSIPTISAEGSPKLTMGSWAGILAPANTPTATIELLNRKIAAIIQEPKAKADIGRDGEPNTPAQFAAALDAEYARWIDISTEIGLRAK